MSNTDSSASTPALTHGDLWLPNILLRDGTIGCVLDFEHATYADRFRDFGKLDEHREALMHIDSVRALVLRMPLTTPWKTSFGAQPDITTVLVRLGSGGFAGWGEATPGTWPWPG